MNLLYVISITIRLIITGYKALSRYNEHKYKIILHVAIRKKAIARWTVLNSQLSCLVERVYDERFASTKDSRIFSHFGPSYKQLKNCKKILML